MSIGARSQSAKTYLETHFVDFEDCAMPSPLPPPRASQLTPSFNLSNGAGDLPTLIKHGLHALRDTLQQDKELTPLNTSLGIIGFSSPTSAAPAAEVKPTEESGTAAPPPVGSAGAAGFQKFVIIEGDQLQPYLDSMDPKEVIDGEATPAAAAAAPAQPAVAPAPAPAPAADAPGVGDAMQTDDA